MEKLTDNELRKVFNIWSKDETSSEVEDALGPFLFDIGIRVSSEYI